MCRPNPSVQNTRKGYDRNSTITVGFQAIVSQVLLSETLVRLKDLNLESRRRTVDTLQLALCVLRKISSLYHRSLSPTLQANFITLYVVYQFSENYLLRKIDVPY